MTAWQIIDLTADFAGRLTAKHGHLLLDGQQLTHLDDALSLLVREDTKLDIHVAVYAQAAKAGVPVVICDHFARPLAIMLPNSRHTRVAARHQAQRNLSEPKRKRAWQEIIRGKIFNQAAVSESEQVTTRLIDFAKAVRSGDTTNREAQAARVYWRGFYSNTFERDKDGKDPVNGALNYGYTILRGICARAVVAAGLWPTAGIFHVGRENAWCLVDDLVEPFRPAVDRVVLGLEGFPSAQAKQQLALMFNAKFADTTTRVAIQEFVEAFALYIEGTTNELTVPKLTI